VSSNTAQFKIDVERAAPSPTPTPTPTTTIIEDNDSHIAYSGGWHLENYANASAGHFRYHAGSGGQHFARLDFSVPSNNTGEVTYAFAKSSKGGTADIYLDGALKERINYAGTGGTQTPDVTGTYQVSYKDLAAGNHTLEIKNMTGVVYVDRFLLVSSTSTAQPSSGPGATSGQSGSASVGQTASSSYQPPPGSSEFSVLAESNLNLPFKMIVVNPSGLTIATADATGGIAVLNVPVNAGGVYVVKVVNLSVGPLQFSTRVTPLVAR
jgi:hypothetical protein